MQIYNLYLVAGSCLLALAWSVSFSFISSSVSAFSLAGEKQETAEKPKTALRSFRKCHRCIVCPQICLSCCCASGHTRVQFCTSRYVHEKCSFMSFENK